MLNTRLALLAAALPLALAAKHELTPEEQAAKDLAEAENWRLCKYTAWTWASIVGGLLFYRLTIQLLNHIRRIANLDSTNDSKQRYFSVPDERWAWLKRAVIIAPLWRKRHNREFKLSAAVNVGVLPGRLQTFFLLGYLAMNMTMSAVTIDWHEKGGAFYSQGRNRTGVLATMNMIPLFLVAGRNNPLIWLLDISFDTMNLLHRWIGRIAVLEAVAHVAFWIAEDMAEAPSAAAGWAGVAASFAHSEFILFGGIGGFAFVGLLLHSPSVIRHAFYETFLAIHQILIIVAIIGVWIHLKMLDQNKNLINFCIAAVVFWVIDRTIRLYKLVRHNTGDGVTKAEVEALPGDAVRVTLRVANPWKFRPGQHIFLYMPSVGLWTSHPFTLAWSQEVDGLTGEKVLPSSKQDYLSTTKTLNMSLIIRRRTGFTDTMYRKAESAPNGRFHTTAFVEGPYGYQSFQSYGTVMFFAAGVGITHSVPHVRDLVAAYAAGTCATRKVVLVWIIQSPEHLEWIRPWMTQILGMEKRRDILSIKLFVTRPRSTKEIHSPSSSVQMFPGKPDVGALISKEQERQVGAMAVSCCGTGGMADDLRRGVRERCELTSIDFHEEAFSW